MSTDTLRILTAGAAMAVIIGVPSFLYVSLTSSHFEVASGSFGSSPTDPYYSQRRRCLGYRYTPESRDGYQTQCVGIPIGPWKCHATLPDEQGRREIPCR